jgi:hypothetical protein
MGVVWREAIRSPGYSCKAESQSCGSPPLVVHYLDSRCCGLAGKAARNAPKCHYSRLRRARVVVPMVAHPIQDLSPVSITYETVGNRLPRLWCAAISVANKAPDKIPSGTQLDILSFLLESNLLLPLVTMRRSLPVFIHKFLIFIGSVLWHNGCAGR